MELPRFRLEKLKIYVFRDDKRQGHPVTTLEAMFNPETYSQHYENIYVNDYQGIRTSGRKSLFKFARSEYLTLTLLLDHTTITPTYSTDSGNMNVYQKVTNFLEVTSYVDGEIREPKYLQIEWGTLIFSCRLVSVDVKYQFFNRAGIPLRASLETKFVKDVDDDKRQKTADASYAAVTKGKWISSSDNLPLIANSLSGDSQSVIRIAEANQLNSIRDLPVGTQIKIPNNI